MGLDMQSVTGTRLVGKVAIVTGGARGIGAATAKLFAHNGAHVIIADILDDLGAKLGDTIEGARYVHCDVSKESDVEKAVQVALKWKGRLDIMFNNAGVPGPAGTIAELDMAQFRALASVNVEGVVHGIKHATRAMLGCGGGGGSIICAASSAAEMGGLAGHAYTASKAAVVGLARSAACELGVHGIRVNCVSAHGVPSEMLVSAYRTVMGKDLRAEEVAEMVAERGSLLRGRCATTDDVAQAALFLGSDEAGFVTGHNLIVDGGYTSACSALNFTYKCR